MQSIGQRVLLITDDVLSQLIYLIKKDRAWIFLRRVFNLNKKEFLTIFDRAKESLSDYILASCPRSLPVSGDALGRADRPEIT